MIKMNKTFEGWLFNRVEILGNREYNHVGCEGDNEKFIDFLTQFVPEIGTRRKVKFTIETQENIEKIEDYKIAKEYKKEGGEDKN